eukprot:scaffold1088_cov247-Pinguiococcus_pyrenoidosus.AAC.15
MGTVPVEVACPAAALSSARAIATRRIHVEISTIRAAQALLERRKIARAWRAPDSLSTNEMQVDKKETQPKSQKATRALAMVSCTHEAFKLNMSRRGLEILSWEAVLPPFLKGKAEELAALEAGETTREVLGFAGFASATAEGTRLRTWRRGWTGCWRMVDREEQGNCLKASVRENAWCVDHVRKELGF